MASQRENPKMSSQGSENNVLSLHQMKIRKMKLLVLKNGLPSRNLRVVRNLLLMIIPKVCKLAMQNWLYPRSTMTRLNQVNTGQPKLSRIRKANRQINIKLGKLRIRVKISEQKTLKKARRKEIAGKISSIPMGLSARPLLHDIYSKIHDYPELFSKTVITN